MLLILLGSTFVCVFAFVAAYWQKPKVENTATQLCRTTLATKPHARHTHSRAPTRAEHATHATHIQPSKHSDPRKHSQTHSALNVFVVVVVVVVVVVMQPTPRRPLTPELVTALASYQEKSVER